MDEYNLSWIDRIFVINLERSKRRLENVMSQARKYKLNIERFPAVDGSKLTDEEKKYIHPICKYFLCSTGSIGCGLSHYFILKKIVEENIDTTLVLEDDFIWREDSLNKIEKFRDFRDGILKLSCAGPFCKGKDYDPEKANLCPFAIGNAGYIIRLEHAKIFLKLIKNVKYHIDVQYTLVSKYHSIPMYYNDCIDVAGMEDSTIGDRNSTLLNRTLPLSESWKWMMNEPFASLFGINVHLFLVLTILIFVLGWIFYKKNKWVGIFLISLAMIDILYYVINKMK